MFINQMTSVWMTMATMTVSPGALDVQDVVKQMNSDATAGEKTSFLIEYLLAQREPLMNLGKTLLMALIVFFIGRRLIKIMLGLMNRWMGKSNIEVSVYKFVISLSRILLNILLLFIIAGMLGVGTSSIVAIVGSAGLAIGLALQGSLANFAGGILILLLNPFRVGDYIVASGVEGTVKSIDIFYTRIISIDNKMIVVPNGVLSNGNIINNSQEEYRLLIVDFHVGYDTQLQQVKDILMQRMKKETMICQDRFMGINVDKLNPGRIKMQAKAWVATSDYAVERGRLFELIKESLQDQGISIM